METTDFVKGFETWLTSDEKIRLAWLGCMINLNNWNSYRNYRHSDELDVVNVYPRPIRNICPDDRYIAAVTISHTLAILGCDMQ